LTEKLLAQHLESPSGTGRVDPVSSQHALPAKAVADTPLDKSILTGQYAPVAGDSVDDQT
jgi:hypothetical protein